MSFFFLLHAAVYLFGFCTSVCTSFHFEQKVQKPKTLPELEATHTKHLTAGVT